MQGKEVKLKGEARYRWTTLPGGESFNFYNSIKQFGCNTTVFHPNLDWMLVHRLIIVDFFLLVSLTVCHHIVVSMVIDPIG